MNSETAIAETSEVTAPKLFVSNANGRIGLVGYWDCICFDEFAGKDKRVDKTLVDIMKNYMANRSFSRGIEQLTAEASMVFMGNTQKSVPYMLKHSHFFEALPDKYIDSAFLDRIHAYSPGWEVAPIRHELFTSGYGFVVDYIAEVLKRLRDEDFTDDTFKRNDFSYRPVAGGVVVKAQTPEEIQYPTFAAPRTKNIEVDESESVANSPVPTVNEGSAERAPEMAPQPSHIVMPENSKGWSYRRLFAQHLRGAHKITVSDPYVRQVFQVRNMMEFLEMVYDLTPEGDEVTVRLITQSDALTRIKQKESLNQVADAFTGSRVAFSWKLERSPNFHARSIVTDTGWKITIDRGLDFFQKFEDRLFSIEQSIQEARLTRGAEITYLRI